MNKLLQYFMNKPDVNHRALPGLEKFMKGGQPCYECGGSVKKYAIGGLYDCPDQEKDPETGKCKAEVVRGREAAAANKAASADMNAWAKQVAAMDKENARQNAAQTAGQLTFDYDWMQSPVDKADKKAAMAQYKQFFQQNPNVFVPDDTSGYSPEQKYIIASKLKQRLSTPMGAQLAQKKLGVDPRYYDLQRMQSELAPKMGGWNSMRDFLFNVYKEQGGEYDLPQAQWGQMITPVDMGIMASKFMKFFGLDKPNIVRTPASAPKRLSIRDPRKIMMTTGQPLRPNSDLVSGEYDSEDLGNLLTEAKRRKMSYNDMMNLAAMGFQETKWGKSDSNIGHTQGEFGDEPEQDSYSNFIDAYNAKMKDADRLKIKDEATRLQVYNGLGKIFPSTEADYHGFKMKKIYGVPVPKGGIDLRKNPLYGKQVIDIRDNVLKRNPEFMRYMDSTYRAPIPKEEFAQGGPILDPRGQWAHPGKITRIPSNNITMQGVPYPVLGIGSNGQQQIMQPGRNYNFGGASYVDEYPMMQGGGSYEEWYKTIPEFKNDTTSYNLRRAYELAPANALRDFAAKPEARLQTVYQNPQGIYEFMKSKHHPTINGELDWFRSNTPEAIQFRQNYDLDTTSDYYKYVPKKQFGGLWDTNRTAWVDSVNNANMDKNFVQRFFTSKYGDIPTPKSVPGYRPGDRSTHLMGYDPKSKRVYPEVVNMNGKLTYMPGDAAYDYADSKQEYINFPTLEQAKWYSSNGYKTGTGVIVGKKEKGGQHGGLDRWFAEKWVDVKTGKACGRQEGEKRAGYPACRPSRRISSETPKTSSEMSPAEKAKFKASKTSSQRINYNHKRNK